MLVKLLVEEVLVEFFIPSIDLYKGEFGVTVSGQTDYGGWYNPGGDGDDSSFGDGIKRWWRRLWLYQRS